MEQRLGELAEPYHHDPRTARLSKAARGLIAAGAGVIVARGRRSRAAAVAGGVLVLAGSALERFAIVSAGRASAADPKYVVGPQRARSAH
jgi:hypothetical protein